MLDGLAGEVADAYLDSVQEERRAEHGAAEAVHAPGEAITEVAVLDRDGEPTEAVPFMGELTIATTRRPDADVHRIRVDIYRSDGIHVGGTEHFVEERSTAHARLSGTDRAPGAGDLRRVGARVRPGGVVPRRPSLARAASTSPPSPPTRPTG